MKFVSSSLELQETPPSHHTNLRPGQRPWLYLELEAGLGGS